MKKILFRVFLLLVFLLLIALFGAGFFMGDFVKEAVETVGPMVTKTQVKLQSADLSLVTGSSALHGLVIGNPDGFKSPSAVSVALASVSIKPMSLLSDKIVIKSVIVEAPMITFETDLSANNLSKLAANMKGPGGGTDTKTASPSGGADNSKAASKKLELDEFLIRGAKLHVRVTGAVGAAASAGLGSQEATVSMQDIRLNDMGKGPEGITAAELTSQVLTVVLKQAEQQAASVVADLAKGATYLSGEVPTNAVDKAAKSLGDLLKKK
jgi:hypothetical protein